MIERALYAEYLKSDEWFRRRERVMQRAGGICEGCRIQAATEVHHLSHEHITQEFPFELVALCGDCHARWQGQPVKPKPSWTPRHTGRPAAKELPGARARRGQLADLAAKHRAKTMATDPPAPEMRDVPEGEAA